MQRQYKSESVERKLIINDLDAIESGAFSKPSLFQILYIYFLVWVFSEDNATAET